ncbi:MAG: hypothetical protein PHF25_05930 [Candidatus Margulisbacteria bacterium]|nr:hypothetical protein [Candidatus Margulisiibacteriota bacterium]
MDTQQNIAKGNIHRHNYPFLGTNIKKALAIIILLGVNNIITIIF